MSAGIMTGPYDIPVYHGRAITVCTNKSPLGSLSRGRPQRRLLCDRNHDRRGGAGGRPRGLPTCASRTWFRRQRCRTAPPPTSSTTAATIRECARRAVAAIDVPKVRARQQRGEADGRMIGVGLASYTEQTAHGTAEWVARGLPVVFGYEPALARLTPDGKLVLFVGIQNHGQGLETTLAQVAHQELGIAVADVVVRHGDSCGFALRNGHVRVAQHDHGGRRGIERLRPAWRENQPHRRASAAGAARRPSRLRAGGCISARRACRFADDRPRRLPASGATAGGGGAGARGQRGLPARRAAPAHFPTRPTPAWSRSIPAPASSRCSTTSSVTTAARWSIR